MILVSSPISKEEFPDFEDDITFLFPKYTLTNVENPNIKIQIVSIQDFPNIFNNSVPILTPLSVHQMREKKIDMNLFSCPLCGFINLHLYQRKVAFSGFGSSRQKLKDMSYRMGAIVERSICSKTSLLVSKNLKSDMAQAALKFNIPIVTDNFIYDLFTSKENLNEKDYKLKLFSGLVLTTSGYSKNEKEELEKYIIENGGTFRNGLYLTNNILVAKPSHASKKLKEAIDMKQEIITEGFKELYSTPSSLRNISYVVLIPSNLFNNMTFYISPKLEVCYSASFHEFKIHICQYGGHIIDDINSANYIIQMDMDNDNFPEKHSQNEKDAQNIGYKQKSNNDTFNNSIINYSSSNSNFLSRLRTPIWIERCIEEGQILPPSDFLLFSPTKRSKRNGNFHVSLTGFSEKEYLNLNSTLKWLDIRYSPRFKKSMTHLIAKENHISKKTQAAAEWDIPIVGVDWLFNIAEGNLTSEALSNPWSPKRSQKTTASLTVETKSKFDLNISEDDDDDVEIIEDAQKNQKTNETHNLSQQKQQMPVQNIINNQNLNKNSKLNSPLLMSNSSSQRIPPSPKKIQLASNNSNRMSTISQPKNAISFLDDDDDDDFYAVDYYEEMAAHKMIVNDFKKLDPKPAEVIQQVNNPKEQALSPIQNFSPKKQQSQAKSYESPKHVQQKHEKKTVSFLLSSSSDCDEDILSLLDNPAPAAKSATTSILQNSQAKSSSINSSQNLSNTNINRSISSNASFQSTLRNINPEAKSGLQAFQNAPIPANSPSKPLQFTNQAETASYSNAPSTPKNTSFPNEKTITPPSAFQCQQGQNYQNKNLFEIGMHQPSPPPQPSRQQNQPRASSSTATAPLHEAQRSSANNSNFTIKSTTSAPNFAQKDSTNTNNYQNANATNTINYQNTNSTNINNYQNTNATNINNYQNTNATNTNNYQNTNSTNINNYNNTNATNSINYQNTNATNTVNYQNPKAAIISDNLQKANSVNPPQQQLQPQKAQVVRNFLSDDDDDDDFDEMKKIEENVKIADATQRILKAANAKRRVKKRSGARSEAKKVVNEPTKDHFGSENSDSQFDTLESFTQRPNDLENDEPRFVSYDEIDEPKKEAVAIDDEDPFLKILQK